MFHFLVRMGFIVIRWCGLNLFWNNIGFLSFCYLLNIISCYLDIYSVMASATSSTADNVENEFKTYMTEVSCFFLKSKIFSFARTQQKLWEGKYPYVTLTVEWFHGESFHGWVIPVFQFLCIFRGTIIKITVYAVQGTFTLPWLTLAPLLSIENDI